MSNLKVIDLQMLDRIRQSWMDQAGADEFIAELGTVFDGMERDVKSSAPDSGVFVGLCDESEAGNEKFDAIVELIDTRRGSMTKVLTINLSPEYWQWEHTEAQRDQVILVYTTVLAHMISFGEVRAEDGQHDLKIFGRAQPLFEMLGSVQRGWNHVSAIQENHSSVAKMEGRWLKISIKPNPNVPEEVCNADSH